MHCESFDGKPCCRVIIMAAHLAGEQDLRSCIHIARRAAEGAGGPLVAGASAAVGIRVLPSGQLLDCSPGFEEPSGWVGCEAERYCVGDCMCAAVNSGIVGIIASFLPIWICSILTAARQ